MLAPAMPQTRVMVSTGLFDFVAYGKPVLHGRIECCYKDYLPLDVGFDGGQLAANIS